MTNSSEELVYLSPCHPPVKLSKKESKHVKLANLDTDASFDQLYSFIILGASGDLSRKQIYPSLWNMYRDKVLPPKTKLFGFARSKITVNDVKERAMPYIKLESGDEANFDAFWSKNMYQSGFYNNENDFEKLNLEINKFENGEPANRIFYFAIPPCVFEVTATNIKNHCMAPNGWTRIVLEKPFGRDLPSYETLHDHIFSQFTEQQIFCVDHYLGKEMVQNILAFRFANRILTPTWNRHHIACVRVTFKEDFGTKGRGGYFDDIGMIRDVMQNHLLQILALVAMEKPKSGSADDIKDAKVKLLQAISPLDIKDVVLGQYVRNPDNQNGEEGYLDDPTVPKGSVTNTYVMAVFKINNERWNGVPFIVSSGKAIDERKVEVRVQYLKSDDGDIFTENVERNELVLRIQPGEAIYVKMNIKKPGTIMEMDLEETELDLTYSLRYPDQKLPSAYERLLPDVFRGSEHNFVRSDELKESWRIFTPLLHYIENGKVKPTPYFVGSRGPPEEQDMLKKNNFVHSKTYRKNWRPIVQYDNFNLI